MNTIYQHTKADGDPDWNDGRSTFAREWDVVGDLARFHRGQGFRIKVRGKDKDYGPVQRLHFVRDRIAHILEVEKPGTVVQFRSESDDVWSMLMRKLNVESAGDKIVEWFEKRIGTPYKLGFSGPNLYDCSGATMEAHEVQGIWLPHNAHDQHDLFRGGRPGFVPITRASVQPGDMVFTNDDAHVCVYYGQYRGVDCCIDTEPSDTQAPWGGMLGTGIQIRPMTGNYYNSWEGRVNGVGRILSVNGPA